MDKKINTQDKILEVKNLRISFKTNGGTVKAVRGVSFSLYRGRTLAIVGESGSGKSVTSKAILGILANNKIVEDGQIIYDGKDLLKISEDSFCKIRGVKISMIFQDPLSSLNPIMIVGKQLTEAMILKHKADKKEARKTLERFNRGLSLANKEQAKALEESIKKEKKTSIDVKANHDLFKQAITLSLLKRDENISKAIATLDQVNEKFVNPTPDQIPLMARELKPLCRELGKCVSSMAVESDNDVEVFPTIVKDILLGYKESLSLLKDQSKPLTKYHVESFFDLPPALRAKLREVIISPEEHLKQLLNAISQLKKHLQDVVAASPKEQEELTSKVEKAYNEFLAKKHSELTKKEAKERAISLLGEVGIAEPEKRYKQYPFELSGGMRQRIVIAIALSSSPEVLICDEPTTALDVSVQAQILELINKLKKEKNLSIIFITHDLGVVANMADDIAVMYAGKIVEYGTATEIFYDPRHPYTWALLGSMPDLETKEKLNAIPGTPPNMLLPPRGDAFADRNVYALDIDKLMLPPFFEVSPTHYAATWNLHKEAPDFKAPKIVVERIRKALLAHPEYKPQPINLKNSILNYYLEDTKNEQ
jgi:oligopeptide transport system ATP-binding protein